MSDFGAALLAQLDTDDLDTLAAWLHDRLSLSPAPPPSTVAYCWLSPAEVAKRLGVHVETIRRAVRDGGLPAAKVGSAIRIDPADLAAWQPFRRGRAQRQRPSRTAAGLRRSPMRDALHALRSVSQ